MICGRPLESARANAWLDKLPKSLHRRAKELLHDIYLAPGHQDALKAYERFLTNHTVCQKSFPKSSVAPLGNCALFTPYFGKDLWQMV